MNTSMYEQRLASIFVTERKEKAASARKLEAAKAKGKNETHAEETHATEILATEEKARGHVLPSVQSWRKRCGGILL